MKDDEARPFGIANIVLLATILLGVCVLGNQLPWWVLFIPVGIVFTVFLVYIFLSWSLIGLTYLFGDDDTRNQIKANLKGGSSDD